MDRLINYPGAVPLETDLLNTNRNILTAIAKLSAAIFGASNTIVNGLAVSQTTVPSMQVSVAAGEIYMATNLDSTAYSSLAADIVHTLVKQGISLDPQLLALTAPGTVGFSVNYLIEATFTESDNTPVVLPYYNSSNPSSAYSGPAGAGTTNNTKRQGLVTLVAKAGTAATTGTQTTPAPDSGYVGLAVVTVAYGAVSVTNSNISAYIAAPVLPAGGLIFGAQQNAVAAGTADALTATFLPAPAALSNGLTYLVRANLANATTTPTFSPNGLTAHTIVKGNGLALAAGDIAGAGHWLEMQFDSALGQWVLQNPATGIIGSYMTAAAVAASYTPLTEAYGISQTPQNKTSSRVSGTVYQNTGAKAITVMVNAAASTNNGLVFAMAATSTVVTVLTSTCGNYSGSQSAGTITVPPGWYYSVTVGGSTIGSWWETA